MRAFNENGVDDGLFDKSLVLEQSRNVFFYFLTFLGNVLASFWYLWEQLGSLNTHLSSSSHDKYHQFKEEGLIIESKLSGFVDIFGIFGV